MPIYEYQCETCGHKLERLQKISDDPLKDCPRCDKATLTKLVSAAAFRLKGSGWYETDFKKGSKKNLVGASESADASPQSKEDGKQGGKPDSKTDKSSSSASVSDNGSNNSNSNSSQSKSASVN